MNRNTNIEIWTGKITESIFLPKKIKQNIILIKIILEYSAKKMKANPAPLYSTLNPETNSDSPSEKSNGDRFVSAIDDEIQANDKGNIYKICQIYSWIYIKSIKLYLSVIRIGHKIIKTNLTSYEIVWAIDRIAPNKA